MADGAADNASDSMPPPPPVGFAKRSKNRNNVRKRQTEDEDGNGQDDSVVVRRVKNARDGSTTFSTKREDKTENFRFEASRTLQQTTDEGATRHYDVDTEHDRDARYVVTCLCPPAPTTHLPTRAIREKQLKISANPEEAAAIAGQYKGMSSYIDFKAGFRRELHLSSDKAKGSYGPLRSNAQFVRSSIRVDYQPDVCKDYKETGYCGYGDSCKFMHDRGDYKMGWEIDRVRSLLYNSHAMFHCCMHNTNTQCVFASSTLSSFPPCTTVCLQEWEEKQAAERKRMQEWADRDGEEAEEEEAEDDDDGLPFACWICRRHWDEQSDPVVTKCGHHFCEHCALKHNAKNKRCAVCDQPTMGIFNTAHDIVKKIHTAKTKAHDDA